ncbi:unnamed protein product [Amoebophrya sp. A120]|nr:unnamed protein product [Amoebophrya sp. A120]|eukprot:GSA120T00006552001.1
MPSFFRHFSPVRKRLRSAGRLCVPVLCLLCAAINRVAHGLPISNVCRYDLTMVEVVERTLDPLLVKLQKKCTQAQSDIFQRVSGHLVKHKLEQFCREGVSVLLGTLQILEGVCADFERMYDNAVKQNRFVRRERGQACSRLDLLVEELRPRPGGPDGQQPKLPPPDTLLTLLPYLGFDPMVLSVALEHQRQGVQSSSESAEETEEGAAISAEEGVRLVEKSPAVVPTASTVAEAIFAEMVGEPLLKDILSRENKTGKGKSDPAIGSASGTQVEGSTTSSSAPANAVAQDEPLLSSSSGSGALGRHRRQTEALLRVVFHDTETLKETLLRSKMDRIAASLRQWNHTTTELLADFSTGEEWRLPLLRNFAEFLEDESALFPANPMKLANHLLNFAPYIVEATLATVKEVVNYHLADFHVKHLPTLLQQIEAFPQLVQPELRLTSEPLFPVFEADFRGTTTATIAASRPEEDSDVAATEDPVLGSSRAASSRSTTSEQKKRSAALLPTTRPASASTSTTGITAASSSSTTPSLVSYSTRSANLCRSVLGFDNRRDPLLAKRRLFTDVTGLYSLQPGLLDHLEYYHEQLSYTIVAMQPRAVIGSETLQDTYRQDFGRSESVANSESVKKLTIGKDDLQCSATGLAFTPSKCLFDAGWGSLTFTINTEPPYDATLTVSEMTEKNAAALDWARADDGSGEEKNFYKRPQPFVQPVSNGSESYEEILEAVDGVYKTLNHPTPDFMFLSPLVGNCMMMEKLGRSRDDQGTTRKRDPQLAPKLILVPINPLIPPPFEFVPDFNKWHEHEFGAGGEKGTKSGSAASSSSGGTTSSTSTSTSTPIDDASWLFVQCSLTSTVSILEKQNYALLQVDHMFALFGRKKGPSTKFDEGPLKPEELWLQGWFCSSVAKTFMALAWKSGLDTDFLLDNSLDPLLRKQELCRFQDRFSLPMHDDGQCAAVSHQLRAEEQADLAQDEAESQAAKQRENAAAPAKPDGRAGGQEPADSSLGSLPASSLQAKSSLSLFDGVASEAAALGTLIKRNDVQAPEGTSSGVVVKTAVVSSSTSVGGVPAPRAFHEKWFFLRDWDLQNPKNELGKKYLLEQNGRGRCLDDLGFCECFIPYRGRWCEEVEYLRSYQRGPLKKKYRAALHYLVGNSPRLLRDIRVSLQILWKNYNRAHEYPVVIFHDGLPPETRQYLVESSHNALWFAFVEDYTKIPKHLATKLPQSDFAGYPLGYRGMCRFRSGPIFLHPILRNMDYAFTLDTDGYFPAPVQHDPIERMHRENRVYMYSHISRDQAGQVQHFWEFTRLYLEHKQYNPKSTKLMRRITDALVMRDTYWHEWNRLLFMNDIELVKLSWFQSPVYQDYFQFLDSMGGFWLYRWGDHGIRTIAIALHLGEEFLAKLNVPYSHQSACVCPEDPARGRPMKCVKRKDKKKQDEHLFHTSQDVSRSYKFECVYVEPGEKVPSGPEAGNFGVVDPDRFFGGS